MISSIFSHIIGHSYIFLHEIPVQILSLLDCLIFFKKEVFISPWCVPCDPLCLGWPSSLSLSDIPSKVWFISPLLCVASPPLSQSFLPLWPHKISFPHSTTMVLTTPHHDSELHVSVFPQTGGSSKIQDKYFSSLNLPVFNTVPTTLKYSDSLKYDFRQYVRDGIATCCYYSHGGVRADAEYWGSPSFIHSLSKYFLSSCYVPGSLSLGCRHKWAKQNLCHSSKVKKWDKCYDGGKEDAKGSQSRIPHSGFAIKAKFLEKNASA